jgi:hypothetical protein
VSTPHEAFDQLMKSMNLIKVVDVDYNNLNRNVTEKCEETEGTGSCISEISGEFTVVEAQFPLIGAIGVYIEWGWTWSAEPLGATIDCLIDIEIIGEGDNYKVVLHRVYYDKCVI